ncbi:MAG: hypothetical protein ACRCYY_20755 [Trueperaceae bacterium]
MTNATEELRQQLNLEREIILEEQEELDEELFEASNGYASSQLTMLLSLITLLVFPNWNTFFVFLIWTYGIFHMFLMYGGRYNTCFQAKTKLEIELKQVEQKLLVLTMGKENFCNYSGGQ